MVEDEVSLGDEANGDWSWMDLFESCSLSIWHLKDFSAKTKILSPRIFPYLNLKHEKKKKTIDMCRHRFICIFGNVEVVSSRKTACSEIAGSFHCNLEVSWPVIVAFTIVTGIGSFTSADSWSFVSDLRPSWDCKTNQISIAFSDAWLVSHEGTDKYN